MNALFVFIIFGVTIRMGDSQNACGQKVVTLATCLSRNVEFAGSLLAHQKPPPTLGEISSVVKQCFKTIGCEKKESGLGAIGSPSFLSHLIEASDKLGGSPAGVLNDETVRVMAECSQYIIEDELKPMVKACVIRKGFPGFDFPSNIALQLPKVGPLVKRAFDKGLERGRQMTEAVNLVKRALENARESTCTNIQQQFLRNCLRNANNILFTQCLSPMEIALQIDSQKEALCGIYDTCEQGLSLGSCVDQIKNAMCSCIRETTGTTVSLITDAKGESRVGSTHIIPPDRIQRMAGRIYGCVAIELGQRAARPIQIAHIVNSFNEVFCHGLDTPNNPCRN